MQEAGRENQGGIVVLFQGDALANDCGGDRVSPKGARLDAVTLLLRAQQARRAQGGHDLENLVEPKPRRGFAQVRHGGGGAKVRAVAQSHDQRGQGRIVLDQGDNLIDVHIGLVEQFRERRQIPRERRKGINVPDNLVDAQHKATSWSMPETLSATRPVSMARPMVRLTWPPSCWASRWRLSRRSHPAKAARLRRPMLNRFWSSIIRAPPAR